MLFHDVYKILFALNFSIKSLPVLNDTDLGFMKAIILKVEFCHFGYTRDIILNPSPMTSRVLFKRMTNMVNDG